MNHDTIYPIEACSSGEAGQDLVVAEAPLSTCRPALVPSTNRLETRGRLDTEDTLKMNNIKIPDLLLEDNPFLECQQNFSPLPLPKSEPALVSDCASSISSLSSGSFKQPPPQKQQHQQEEEEAQVVPPPGHPALPTPRTAPDPVMAGANNQVIRDSANNFVPPKEIVIKVETEIPDWLLPEDESNPLKEDEEYRTYSYADDDTAENNHQHEQSQKHHPLTPRRKRRISRKEGAEGKQHCLLSPVWTDMPSPAIPRPTFGRFKTYPGLFPVRTPRVDSNGQSDENYNDPINNHSNSNTAVRAYPFSPVTSNAPSSDNTNWSTTPRASAPMSRRLPTHKRTASAGTCGNESWLTHLDLTAPTAASSCNNSHSLLANLSFMTSSASTSKRSAVIQEIKHIWDKVKGSNGSTADLQRSTGCLT